jgi:predicted PurR-regulated permease PerM
MTFLATSRERAGLLILALAVGVGFAVAPFLSGLLGAAVLYVVFVHLYRWLERAMRPAFAAVITLGLALLMVALPLAWLIAVVVAQAPDALRTLQSSAVFSGLADLRIADFHIGAEVAKASGTISTWLSARVFSSSGVPHPRC